MRYATAGKLIALIGVAVAPFAAFALGLADPELAGTTFISASDGSTGPSFDACLHSWLVLTVGALALGGAVAVAGRRRDAARSKGS